MAINIFSGTSGRAKVNSAQNSTRAQAAKSALIGPSEVSNSGTTAVKSSGTLSKIGNTVGRIAGVASKFLPGLGGTIAKGISNLFNDPEWWQSVPGDALTLNSPLRVTELGDVGEPLYDAAKTYQFKMAIGELCSTAPTIDEDGQNEYDQDVIAPSPTAITQYLMPEIRKVVNAIPLQSADAYDVVMRSNATLYALWRQLKKFDYLLKHGQTYIANLNDPQFPLLQVENAAYLQSTINRLEEYLRASVRLPHTMCEYLAWRFGRVYKSNDSAKSALIMYNVVGVARDTEYVSAFIAYHMNRVNSTEAYQKANADLYNTYYDHDFMVEIRDDTQFQYDGKEFMLRTNCRVYDPRFNFQYNAISIDSRLDNPTTFMASSVSAIGVDDSGDLSCLFPVKKIAGFIPAFNAATAGGQTEPSYILGRFANQPCNLIYDRISGSQWMAMPLISVNSAYNYADGEAIDPYFTYVGTAPMNYTGNTAVINYMVTSLLVAKSLDIYNKNVFMGISDNGGSSLNGYDMTSLSIDTGLVDDRVLGIEHIYAFANLVHVERKTSMSYQKAEKLVARDTANMIESLDVATAGTPTK
jgi:hypothetical protein